MQRHRLTYRQVREILETPQDVMDFGAAIARVAEQRGREFGA